MTNNIKSKTSIKISMPGKDITVDRSKEFSDLLKNKFSMKNPSIDELLYFCSENNCSDLYIRVDSEPYISRFGRVYKIPCFPTTTKIWNAWEDYAITSENNATYVRSKMLDMSYTIYDDVTKESMYRYRVSVGFSYNKNMATFRMITKDLPTFKNLNFPKDIVDILYNISKSRSKITMIVGPTGSGKTTTMAACINDFTKENEPMADSVIISLEDPVEYIYYSTDQTNIIQKELRTDFKNFEDGIKQALREHPTFINVGETRDKETINALVEASRTGHSVWTSFHASDVADTIARLKNHLISSNKDIIYDLINNMNIILCQRIKSNGEKFELETQYMVFNEKVVYEILNAIESGESIQTAINNLFSDEELIKNKIIQDWK